MAWDFIRSSKVNVNCRVTWLMSLNVPCECTKEMESGSLYNNLNVLDEKEESPLKFNTLRLRCWFFLMYLYIWKTNRSQLELLYDETIGNEMRLSKIQWRINEGMWIILGLWLISNFSDDFQLFCKKKWNYRDFMAISDFILLSFSYSGESFDLLSVIES